MTPYPNRDAFEDVCEALANLIDLFADDVGVEVPETIDDENDFIDRIAAGLSALARARNEKETE